MSYATDAELISYALARGITVTSAEAPILLVKAKDWLDIQPITFDTDDVPQAIKDAQMVGALLIHAGYDLFQPDSDRVVSESISGAVSTTYAEKSTYFIQLEALIAPYVTVGKHGGNVINLVRG